MKSRCRLSLLGLTVSAMMSALIVALWIRSQFVTDFLVVSVRDEVEFTLVSGDGALYGHRARFLDPPITVRVPSWEVFPHRSVYSSPPRIFPGVRSFRHQDFSHLGVPYWMLFLLAFGAFGGFVCRFNIRRTCSPPPHESAHPHRLSPVRLRRRPGT